jgi:hypothetical protein
VLRPRLWSILVVVSATLALLPAALRVEVEPGSESWVDRNGEAYVRSMLVAERFGPSDDIVVAYFGDDVLDRAVVAWERRLIAAVRDLPGVRRVDGLTEADDVVFDEFGVGDVPLIDADSRALTAAEQLAVRDHPIYSGLLIAKDGRGAAVLVKLVPDLAARDVQGLAAELRHILKRTPPPAGVVAHIGGLPIQKLAVAEVVSSDERRMLPLIAVLLSVMLLALLGFSAGALACLGAVASTTIAVRALLALTGTTVDALLTLLLPLVMAVTVATSLHLVIPVVRAASRRRDPVAEVRRVTLPILMTAATTAAGLLGLVLGPVTAVGRFGQFAVAGVVIATLCSYAWVWAVWPFLAGSRAMPETQTARLLRRLGTCLIDLGLARPTSALLVAGTVVAAAASQLPRIRVDAGFVAALPESSEVRQAHAEIDRSLTGTLPLEILIDLGREPTAADLDRVEEVTRVVRAWPGVRHALSLADLVRLIQVRAVQAGFSPPETQQALDDLREFGEEHYQRWVGAGFDAEPSHALRISARQSDGSAIVATGLRAPVLRAVKAAFPEAAVVLASGHEILLETTERVVPSVLWGLLVALPTVSLLIGLSLRSWRLALVAWPVVGLPVLVVYGVLPCLGWPLDVGVSMIACVALGIVVDDTIHLLAALDHAGGPAGGPVAGSGILEALHAVSPVLVATSLTLMLAFLASMTGEFAHTRHFGLLLALAFGLALIANLVLVPAIFRERIEGGRPVSSSSR